MKYKILILLFINFLINLNTHAKEEVLVKFKIDNEIITNVDIKNEEKYLKILNNQIAKMPKNQIESLAENSIINEKIKLIEVSKYFEINKQDKKIVENILINFINQLNFKNKNNFEKYLKNIGLNVIDIEKKIIIESLWNRLVFQKYKNSVKIDKKKLEKDLKKQINANKESSEELSLSEILFKLGPDEKLSAKTNLITNDIKRLGFENAAIIYSISETKKYGGKIGWLKKPQLSKKIISEIDKINKGEFTRPIDVDNGYLILKIIDKRKIKKKINFEEEINKKFNAERNKQLNQFSIIYFNKVKQNISISET